MPSWKKVITSGSDAVLNTLNTTTALTASGLNYPTSDNGEESFLQTNGSGNLSFQYVKTIYEEIYNGELTSITKGTPVYISGSVGANAKVFRADASDPSKMPVIYIAADTIASGDIGRGIALGLITGVDTTGYPPGTEIYVAPGGGWTSTRPTGSNIVQLLGIVTKEGVGGQGVILNPGPYNNPNIQSGHLWVGNNDSQPTPILTSSLSVFSAVSASFASTASTASYVLNAISASYVNGEVFTDKITFQGNSDYAELYYSSNDNNSKLYVDLYDNEDESLLIRSIDPLALIPIVNLFEVSRNTIIYKENNILHSGNFNSYTPTLLGIGASGTWNINILGNSTSVTNGVYTTGDQNIGGTKTFTADVFVNGTLTIGDNLGVDSISSPTAGPIDFSASIINFNSRLSGITDGINAQDAVTKIQLDTKADLNGGNINQASFRTALGLGSAAYNNTSDFYAASNPNGFITETDLAPYQLISGLGSNAYTSTAYLPLTGGTLSGTLNANGHDIYADFFEANGITIFGTVNGVEGQFTNLYADNLYGTLTGTASQATKLTNTQANWIGSNTIGNVVGLLAWKAYGNGHVIFDASAGTSPSGTTVSQTNPDAVWSASYPTLMGWNGSNTYGVRVDSSRVADSATNWGNSPANFDTFGTGTIGYLVGYDSGGTNIIKPWQAPAVRTFLGLGSAAYLNASQTATGNSVVQRDSSGHINSVYSFSNYVNTSDDVSTGALTYLMGKFGDNYLRSATPTKVREFLGMPSGGDTLQSVTDRGNSTTRSLVTSNSGGFESKINSNSTILSAYNSDGIVRSWQIDKVNGGLSIFQDSVTQYNFTMLPSGNFSLGFNGTEQGYKLAVNGDGLFNTNLQVNGTTITNILQTDSLGGAANTFVNIINDTTIAGYLEVAGYGYFTGDITINKSSPAFHLSAQQVNGRSYSLISGIVGVNNAGFSIRDNTAGTNPFYIDAAGTSYGNGARLVSETGTWNISVNGTANSETLGTVTNRGSSFTTRMVGVRTQSSSWVDSAFESQSTNNPGYAFHVPGVYAAALYMNSAGTLNWAGNGIDANVFRGIHQNNGQDAFYLNNAGNNDFRLTAAGVMRIINAANTVALFNINNDGVAVFNSTVSAGGGFFDTSDARFKDILNIKVDGSSIKGISYKWKGVGRDTLQHFGYLAQDVEKVMPWAIQKDSEGFMSVRYNEVFAVKIDNLEDEVIKLRARVAELEGRLN